MSNIDSMIFFTQTNSIINNDVFDWSDRELSSKQSKCWYLLPRRRNGYLKSKFSVLGISQKWIESILYKAFLHFCQIFAAVDDISKFCSMLHTMKNYIIWQKMKKSLVQFVLNSLLHEFESMVLPMSSILTPDFGCLFHH